MNKPNSYINIAGEKYNRLTAIEVSHKDRYSNEIWECRCDCGETSFVRKGALRAGRIKQCNKCASRDKMSNFIENNRLKSIFSDMKRRCYDARRNCYKHYGGRGIAICKEWLEDPLSFEKWSLDNGYKEYLSIDRIDNDGDYEPENCRWADDVTQANNRSNNKVLEYKGTFLTLAQWAERLGVHRDTMYYRLENIEDEDVIFSPISIRQLNSKSGINGISWINGGERWTVRNGSGKERVFIGNYKSLENAIFAKDSYISKGLMLKESEIERQIKTSQ